MTQDQINGLHNTNGYWRVLFGSMLCQIMEQIRPKTGNPLAIVFNLSMLLLMLYIPRVFQKSHHDTGSDQLFAQPSLSSLIFLSYSIFSLN